MICQSNKKIDLSDLLDLNTYSKERKAIRKEVAMKNRRVELDHILLSTENFFTMKAQIQEMLYIEKGGDEQLRDELEAYNPNTKWFRISCNIHV